jgi:hypothetical protein
MTAVSFILFLGDVCWFSKLVENLAVFVFKAKLQATQFVFTNRTRGSLGYSGDFMAGPPCLHVPSDSHQAFINRKQSLCYQQAVL